MDAKAALKARLEALSPQQRAALLQKLAAQRQAESAAAAPASAGQRYPLSLAQRRLWLLSQLGSEASAAYNIAAAFCFDEGLQRERLRRAWRALLQDHEVLRSAFLEEAGELYQLPRAAADWDLQTRALDAQQPLEAQLQQAAATEAARPFDLQQDWLLRVYCWEDATGAVLGLIVVMHHIVCDGLSIAGMIEDLAQYYAQDGEQPGTVPLLSAQDSAPFNIAPQPARLQYRDYVDYEAHSDTQQARRYWQQQFATAPETLDTLLDLPRPLQKDFRGAACVLTLGAAEVAAFEALCHGNQATLYMGLVALVQVLLARMADVGEVTLGTPVAGRPAARFERVVGPFVNTIALRQPVDRAAGFASLLQQVRRRVLDGFAHQGLAFDELVTALGFAKDPSRSPLYDVMLGLTSAADTTLAFGGSRGRVLRIPPASSKVDMTFHFERQGDGSLRLDLEYASALLLEATVARLCRALRLLLLAVTQQPACAVGSIALQTDAERRQLLEGINATVRPYPRESALVTEFRRSVAAQPDAIAVHAGAVQLSYRALDALSDRLAQLLLQHPAHHAGCSIALLLEKDERALLVILAILKSGAVYVPLAANTPRERITQVLAAGAVRLLVAHASRHDELQDDALALLEVDALLHAAQQLLQEPAAPALPLPDPATAAYLMFTSGSTGQPKGTLIEQRAVLRLVCGTDYHQVQPGERVLLTGSLAFDAATFEIWGPLLNGGCVCIPAGTTLLEVHEFQALVDHYQVDTAFLTTGLFNQLVDNSAAAFARLRTVLTGGEKISVEHVRKLRQAQPTLDLLHVYGPTENTTFSTWHRITAEDLAQSTIPIGRPIANSRIYLLDAALQPVPPGVPGEIYCGGDGIARGYLETPDSARGGSAAAFLPDPFAAEPGARLYRTGDRAKWNTQQELVFLGRQDRQVKIRGFRVELGEVEYHLRQLPGVSDAHVQAREAGGSTELLAWLVAPAEAGLTLVGVREALKDRLPNYMLPARLLCLPRLPLNASGKVDLKALPEPAAETAASPVAAQLQGQQELLLAQLYARVLGLPDSAAAGIDRSANFFALGGDSIRAIQLVSLARAAGCHFALKDIFASETLAGLAAMAKVDAVSATTVELQQGPLSPTQQWWLEFCGAPANHFNLSSVFRLAQAPDLKVLQETLDELLVLHPALRLKLDPVAQQQQVRSSGRHVLRVAAAGQSRQQLWAQLQQAIDLDAGILLTVGVAVEDDAAWLAVVVHHLAADEVSGRLFAENLTRVYQRRLAQQHAAVVADADAGAGASAADVNAAAVPEPLREAIGPVTWAAQLQALVEQGGLDADLEYWREVVAQGSALLARQPELFREAERSEAMLRLPAAATAALLQLAQTQLRMQPQELLLAAFVRAWQHCVGLPDCLLMLEGHGREQQAGLGDCSSTLGWFTSLYPFVLVDAGSSQLDLYRRVKDALRAIPARGFSYLPLRYCSDEQTHAALTLRPQLSFNYLGESQPDQTGWLQPAGESAGSDHGAAVSEPFRLDVLARIDAGSLELQLRGQAPRAQAGLAALASAWQDELLALTQQLQAAGAAAGLLSLSDSLVPFASLAALDATLQALQLAPAAVEAILPLTGVQSGMWLHCSTQPVAYQDQVALRLQQPLDIERFAAAVATLVVQTQALRTCFAQAPNGELLQIVLRAARGRQFHAVDGSHWGEQADTHLQQLRAALRAQPRDLLHDPLFSLTLVQLAADCFELIIDFHHLALDGWTSALLLQQLEALYFGADGSAEGPALGGMGRYFEWLQRQPTDAARDYWQTLLGDYQGRSEVPAHLPRVAQASPAPLFVETRLGTELDARLRAWCEQQGLTLNAALQTLWGLFLGRMTGSDDVVFGATVSGRDIDLPGVDRIAGMLINTLPVRITAAAADSFAALVRATAQQFAASMACGHLNLADIMALTPARAGLVTHALVFENYPAAEAGAQHWQWQAQDIFDPMHFEFGLIVAPLAGDVSVRFVADGNLYLQETLQQWGRELCALLAALLDEQQPLAALDAGRARGWTLSANFTADSLAGMLQYHEYLSGNSAAVTLLPYDQIVQELINPGSRLRRLPAQHHVVLWRPLSDADGAVDASASTAQLAQLAQALTGYARASKGSCVYVLPCPWFDCDWSLYREFAAFLRGALAGLDNAELLSLETLADDYALQQPCLPPDQVFGDIPYSEAFLAAVANRLQRRRDLRTRAPVKVLVVDADDTLWGGIVGEEGVQGLRLDAVHMDLQRQLLQARAAGALLCLASKNNEEDVRAVFEQRQMPLRWEHFTRVCAGWGPKSQSVLTLADELSLGLDSFVFIDDSPLECEQVLAACPGVLAIRLPPAEQRASFLRHLWLLDARAATAEDARRAQMYAEELQRTAARRTTGSYAAFLESLDIRMTLQPPQPEELPRVAQLSQRTNQFNTSGIRYSESELPALLQQPDTELRCVRVRDKFGDYGLVGSVLLRRAPQAWTLFGFMLSCRVLGRGVEHAILRELAAEAAAAGASELRVDFVRLPRNTPALQFLQGLAAAPQQPGAAQPQAAQQHAALQPGGSVQYVLPLALAGQWQVTADDVSAAADATDAGDGVAAAADSPPAAAVGTAAARRGPRLSAYYCHLAGQLDSGAAILQQLRQQHIVQPTGSIVRRAASNTPPATPTELTLAACYAELLGQAVVWREDSFHALGGHSLKAMMLLSRIVAQFGLTLDLREVLARPVLAELAAHIDAVLLAGGAVADAPVLCALPAADTYPASPGQARLWLLEQLRGEGPSPFHMHATLTLAGAVERQALDLALQALCLRHEALRTSLHATAQGQVRQQVRPLTELALQVQWLPMLADAAALQDCARQQRELPFDLQQAPLLRLAAAPLADGGTALFLTLHHSIGDGWSIGILARDLSLLYQYCSTHPQVDAASAVDAALPAPDALQFRDFAAWQLAWLESEAGARALHFWQQHFAQPVPVLQLPAAAPRPALQDSAGASVAAVIPAALWSSFSAEVARYGLSAFAGLFAALQLVLARLSAQDDFCIGTAVAGRQHAQLESVVGFFVNVLPLRSTLAADSSVAGFLQAVAAEVNACLAHQAVPFDNIVASLALERDLSRSPLFDVLLVLQNTDDAELRFGAQPAQVLPLASTTSQYDLTLNAFPAADGSLQLLAEYSSSIYSAAGMELLLRCLQRTVQSLTEVLSGAGNLDAAAVKVTQLPWLQEPDLAEVRALEGELLETAPCTLPELVRRAVTNARGSISDGVQRWSYAQLLQEMARISALLQSSQPLQTRMLQQQRRQAHIGVIGKRSVHSVAALLGVMQAGAVYVPLDLGNPVARLQGIIVEGEVDLLLSTDEEGAALAAQLQQQRSGLLHLRSDALPEDAALAPRVSFSSGTSSSDSAGSDCASSDCAYMIFTSGSTGKPKGVRITHAAFAAMIRQQIPLFDVQPQDVCGQFAALSFDASLSEIFLALACGASLVIAPDAARSDIDCFMDWLEQQAVTVLTLPPVFLRALNRRPLGRLRVLVTAGEAAVGDDLRHYASEQRASAQNASALRVLNAYGPTETSVCASAYVVDPRDAWPFGVPIGRPLPGVLLSVRDAQGARVPPGVAGELYIGGACVGEGYHGAPELTTQKFTTLADAPGRWYRSGDLVRWRSDGQLEFLGRRDTQLKLRGYRIEPGEIEHAARALPGVADAVVLLHPEFGLLLYCVAPQLTPVSDSAFRAGVLEQLGRELPRYMVPAAVMPLQSFPLSSAGKIDRAALLALATAGESRYEAAVTEAEQLLAAVWQQVLRVARVGRQDDFFALGGDSIKALEVLALLKARGYSCALKDFFAAPRLQALAAVLAPYQDAGRFAQPLSGRVELLPVQDWFLRSRSAAAAQQFLLVVQLDVAPAVTAALLRDCIEELVRQHDALRASFSLQDGQWVQELAETLDPDTLLCVHRCRAATVDDADEQAAIAALACRPFVLERAPLFRLVLVQHVDGSSAAVVLSLHHLIADWVSLRILIADLNALAGSRVQPDAADAATRATAAAWLPPPHLLQLLAQQRSAELQALRGAAPGADYRSAVATMTALACDTGLHREVQTLHLQLPASQLTRLRQQLHEASAGRQQALRLQDLLLAVTMTQLGELFGTATVPVLVESHGRDGALDLARQVAWLTRARLLNLERAAFTPAGAVQEASRVLQPPDIAQPDVFACVAAEVQLPAALPALLSFNYLGEFDSSRQQEALFRLSDKVFEQAIAADAPVDVPMHLEFHVLDGSLEIQLAWSPRVFDTTRVHACWQGFSLALTGSKGGV